MACPPGKKCGQEMALIPVVSGCPPDTAKVLFSGVPTGQGEYLYANITWGQIKSCIGGGSGNSPLPWKEQFLVPDDLDAGETTIIITLDAGEQPVNNSVWISLDGSELPEDISDRVSYIVAYGSGTITISFNQETVDSQLYIVHYEYYPAPLP